MAWASEQVFEQLRHRLDACHQEVIAGPGAGHIEQVPLGARTWLHNPALLAGGRAVK